MSRYRYSSGSKTSDWLIGSVRNNPEGLLLLAAGFALLMRRAGSGSRAEVRPRVPEGDFEDERPSRLRTARHSISEGLSQATEGARDYASGMVNTVSETASSYASAVSDYAGEARHTIARQSAHVARATQSTVQDTMRSILQKQPLAVALAGLAAGAAAAAAFPSTDIERRTLGSAGERLSDATERAGEQLMDATMKAGERLVNAAEERGLTAAGLKELARDVAGEFGNSLSGAQAVEGAPAPSSAQMSSGPEEAGSDDQSSGTRAGRSRAGSAGSKRGEG